MGAPPSWPPPTGSRQRLCMHLRGHRAGVANCSSLRLSVRPPHRPCQQALAEVSRSHFSRGENSIVTDRSQNFRKAACGLRRFLFLLVAAVIRIRRSSNARTLRPTPRSPHRQSPGPCLNLNRHGPIRAVGTFALAAAIAWLGLKRTAAALLLAKDDLYSCLAKTISPEQPARPPERRHSACQMLSHGSGAPLRI